MTILFTVLLTEIQRPRPLAGKKENVEEEKAAEEKDANVQKNAVDGLRAGKAIGVFLLQNPIFVKALSI